MQAVGGLLIYFNSWLRTQIGVFLLRKSWRKEGAGHEPMEGRLSVIHGMGLREQLSEWGYFSSLLAGGQERI